MLTMYASPPQYSHANCKLTSDFLTLKVVFESRVTWAALKRLQPKKTEKSVLVNTSFHHDLTNKLRHLPTMYVHISRFETLPNNPPT